MTAEFDPELDFTFLGRASTAAEAFAPGTAAAKSGAEDQRIENIEEFAAGVLDVVRGFCAVLIGRGFIDAEDLCEDVQRRADFWREKGNLARAEPAEIFVEALARMAEVKRDVVANLLPPTAGVQ